MTLSNDFNLTVAQQAAFEELKRRVGQDIDKKIYDHDDFIYRFLKAKDFVVDQAEEMLRSTLRWRKKCDVDSVLEDYEPPEVLVKYFNFTLLGFDKEGCPVFYAPTGKLDIKGIMMSTKPSDLEKTFIQFTEKAERVLEEQSKKLNKRISNYMFIGNVEGLSFATAADKKGIEFLLHINQIHQDNYPERLKTVYVINASTFFTIHYSIIKNFLTSSLMKRIQVFGTDGWADELREKIDSEQLPAFLGGEKTDPDGNPLCETFVNHLGKVDEKYYIHKSKKSLANNPGTKKLVLPRAAFSEIVIEVEDNDCLIEWEFEIKNRDIGFGLFYREMIDDEEKITELVSLQRQDTQDFAEVGLYKCDKAGTYIMLFDNSYSWIRSKEIYYKVDVVSVKDHKAKLQEKNDKRKE